uniref:Ovule protein n=1 Tax=Haemonchus placei TaxID=6290 RepID=A0A0N4WV08_HAEPC
LTTYDASLNTVSRSESPSTTFSDPCSSSDFNIGRVHCLNTAIFLLNTARSSSAI